MMQWRIYKFKKKLANNFKFPVYNWFWKDAFYLIDNV